MLAVAWVVAAASLAAAVAAAASPVEVGADARLVEVVAAAAIAAGVVAERVQTVALLGAVPKAFVRVRRVWATMLFFLQPATK